MDSWDHSHQTFIENEICSTLKQVFTHRVVYNYTDY